MVGLLRVGWQGPIEVQVSMGVSYEDGTQETKWQCYDAYGTHIFEFYESRDEGDLCLCGLKQWAPPDPDRLQFNLEPPMYIVDYGNGLSYIEGKLFPQVTFTEEGFSINWSDEARAQSLERALSRGDVITFELEPDYSVWDKIVAWMGGVLRGRRE